MSTPTEAIGPRLRAGRERVGLTLLQVAERIHAEPAIVEAIEGDHYEALDAPIYARGHIRHYAEVVGESAAELIALYNQRSTVGPPDLTRIAKAPRQDSHTLVAAALGVIGLFAAAGATWWVSMLSREAPQLTETHVLSAQAPAAPAGLPPTSFNEARAPGPSRVQDSAQLTLRYSAASWTEVYDASGSRLIYALGTAHSTQHVIGTPPLRVVLGNAPGVSVEFNGQTMPIGQWARPDGRVQFSINRAGRLARAKPDGDRF
jgi:cytoskeleton protein RodZ